MENPSLVDQTYVILEELIVTLKIKPGEIITEKKISEQLNIGRTPAREALKKLEAVSLVKIMPRKGIVVTDIKLEEIFQQLELRRAVEGIIMKWAAINATSDEKQEFLRLAKEFKCAVRDKDSEMLIKIDAEFDGFATEVARNEFAKSAIKPLHALTRRLYYMNFNKDPKIIEKINAAHVELMGIIADGEAENAVLASNKIIDLAMELYKKSYLKNILNNY
jgi:DNA-binding GntR family transcriptional regulator